MKYKQVVYYKDWLNNVKIIDEYKYNIYYIIN